jgi:hypothetical protein
MIWSLVQPTLPKRLRETGKRVEYSADPDEVICLAPLDAGSLINFWKRSPSLSSWRRALSRTIGSFLACNPTAWPEAHNGEWPGPGISMPTMEGSRPAIAAHSRQSQPQARAARVGSGGLAQRPSRSLTRHTLELELRDYSRAGLDPLVPAAGQAVSRAAQRYISPCSSRLAWRRGRSCGSSPDRPAAWDRTSSTPPMHRP